MTCTRPFSDSKSKQRRIDATLSNWQKSRRKRIKKIAVMMTSRTIQARAAVMVKTTNQQKTNRAKPKRGCIRTLRCTQRNLSRRTAVGKRIIFSIKPQVAPRMLLPISAQTLSITGSTVPFFLCLLMDDRDSRRDTLYLAR